MRGPLVACDTRGVIIAAAAAATAAAAARAMVRHDRLRLWRVLRNLDATPDTFGGAESQLATKKALLSASKAPATALLTRRFPHMGGTALLELHSRGAVGSLRGVLRAQRATEL